MRPDFLAHKVCNLPGPGLVFQIAVPGLIIRVGDPVLGLEEARFVFPVILIGFKDGLHGQSWLDRR